MAGLDPAIHVFLGGLSERKAWMPGTRPGMTAPPPGKALDALNKRIEAAREKAEQNNLRCFGALAAKEPR